MMHVIAEQQDLTQRTAHATWVALSFHQLEHQRHRERSRACRLSANQYPNANLPDSTGKKMTVVVHILAIRKSKAHQAIHRISRRQWEHFFDGAVSVGRFGVRM